MARQRAGTNTRVLDEEVAKLTERVTELQLLRSLDASRQETALRLLTATLEALVAECTRLLEPRATQPASIGSLTPIQNSPKSKHALRTAQVTPEALRLKLGGTPKLVNVALESVIEEIADSIYPKSLCSVSQAPPPSETKGFLTSKGFFKQAKGKIFKSLKGSRKRTKPASKPQLRAKKSKR
jgi:hypothetical protein